MDSRSRSRGGGGIPPPPEIRSSRLAQAQKPGGRGQMAGIKAGPRVGLPLPVVERPFI
jgi:hypothetical protein